ncbi:MAG TPA: phosphomannomutase [Gammaproteobacteria bacterium]|nr:phosphomannomutase [Gammaproteobacteria bacterium]
MALKFGTSGVRGLVTEMTDRECYLYTRAFIKHLKSLTEIKSIAISGDRRGSTLRIMTAVAKAVTDDGLQVDYCGLIPTPALAYHAMLDGKASIMVTGSHIPDDRNGIKFYMPWGEILKKDEQQVTRYHPIIANEEQPSCFDESGMFLDNVVSLGEANPVATQRYVERYTSLFPNDYLNGVRVVFYQHSTVGRDVIPEILEKLGSEVIRVAPSDQFVPVDTEAVSDPEQLAAWVKEYGADLLASADGDSDRPLVVDELGNIIRGDVMGILTARFLNADSVAVPVSCNTALEKSDYFPETMRTRIGSPFVIEAMLSAIEKGKESVVGYEANGGFLTGSDIAIGEHTLTALPTRDAVIPVLALLALAKESGGSVSRLVNNLPGRFTASGLIKEFPSEVGQRLVAEINHQGVALIERYFGESFGHVKSVDNTDGVRITFDRDDIVHMRPSGNAPEFRCYTESSSEAEAEKNSACALKIINEKIRPDFT